MFLQILDRNWQMRRFGGNETFRPAVVPGTVYTDLLRNGDMEDPFWKDNEIRALPLMEEDYEYETRFDLKQDFAGLDRVLLRFDGLDTIADIYLNLDLVGKACNMHRIWEYDVTRHLKEKGNTLRVVLRSPLRHIREEFAKCRTLGSEDAMDGFVHLRKAHCMFGWDWGAHLPDAGIFRKVSLLGIQKARLESVYIRQEHSPGSCVLHFQVEQEIRPEEGGAAWSGGAGCFGMDGADYTVEITAPDGEVWRYQDSPEQIHIEKPLLWWPNGYGEQPLYQVKVELYADGEAVDVITSRNLNERDTNRKLTTEYRAGKEIREKWT